MKKKNRKPKPTSVRFDDELLSDLDEKCKNLGCSRNDFVKASTEFMVYDTTNFDFGNEQEDEEEPKKAQLIKVEDIREFDCKDGNLFENDSFFGKCSDYELNDGKVYEKNGKYLGKIKQDPKPQVVIIDNY